MPNKDSSFDVAGAVKLVLADLLGEVTVRPGPEGKISVHLEVDGNVIDSFTVERTGTNSVAVRGPKVSVGGIYVNFTAGNITNSKINLGSNPVEVRNLVVAIFVPEGTSVQASRVKKLDMNGLTGIHSVRLGGNSEASLVGGNSCTLEAAGDCDIRAFGLTGSISAVSSGGSVINAEGQFGEAYLEASGGSNITVIGNCASANAEASGGSQIRITGLVAGRFVRNFSGGSTITLG